MLAEDISLVEAARYLGVSRAKLSRMVREGVVSYRHSPLDRRLKLFRIDDLDDLLVNPRRSYPARRRRIPQRM